MESDSTVLCYNTGCGQRFDPSKNDDNTCVYHPGKPVFHDAYKSWSCCSKKTTDFTDFLNIKGCTTANHNNVKPVEVAVEKADVQVEIRESLSNASKSSKPEERPSDTQPLNRLKVTVTSSLQSDLQKLSCKADNEVTINQESASVSPGTSCKNGGCTKSYQTESDNFDTCMHHPGVPVFHEGMKYWTCCTRRTTDFENFLEQVGCTVGKHLWIKPKSVNDIKNSCRYDWYQTGPYVYVTIYAKLPIPEKSYVEVNQVKLHAYIVFGKDHDEFELNSSLVGVINCNSSSVQFAANKVEIKLTKADAVKWSNLFLPDLDTSLSTENLKETFDDTLKL